MSSTSSTELQVVFVAESDPAWPTAIDFVYDVPGVGAVEVTATQDCVLATSWLEVGDPKVTQVKDSGDGVAGIVISHTKQGPKGLRRLTVVDDAPASSYLELGDGDHPPVVLGLTDSDKVWCALVRIDLSRLDPETWDKAVDRPLLRSQ